LQLKRRLHGSTKPGTLLKHHIPIKNDRWDVTLPGFAEIDLVPHSGDPADGEFLQSLNVTDIHSSNIHYPRNQRDREGIRLF
jgi:hypothetical protein